MANLTLKKQISDLLFSEQFADVAFIIGKGSKQKRLLAHRAILSSASPVFDAMLYPIEFPGDTPTKEAKSSLNGNLPEIALPDVDAVAFKKMLQCVYGDVANITAEELSSIVTVSRQFQVEALKFLCVKFLREGVTDDNVCTLFSRGEQLLDERSFALKYIEDNTAKVVQRKDFESLSVDNLKKLLQSNKLTIEEVELFRAVMRWAVAECRRQGVPPTVENKAKVVQPIIRHIRFTNMNMEEFAVEVCSSHVLSEHAQLAIFRRMILNDSSVEVPCDTDLRESVSQWSLHTSQKSSFIALSNKNRTAANPQSGHSSINADVAFEKGVHSWRVTRVTGNTQWLLLGVARPTQHPDGSYASTGVWALTSASQRYYAGQSTSVTSNYTTGPIDLQLDCDKGTLTILNVSSRTNHVLTGIPAKSPLTPHFGIHNQQSISVEPISNARFGMI